MRNDIHSPKNLKPEDYTFSGVYLSSDPMSEMAEETASYLAERLDDRYLPEELIWYDSDSTLNWLSDHRNGICDHCGARFTYGAVFHHKDGSDVVVGHICAQKAFGDTNEARMHELMLKNIKTAKSRVENAIAREKFLNDNPGLREAFTVDHHIIADIHNRFKQYCEISPKQVDLVLKIARQEAEKVQRIIDREKAMETAPVIVEGRQTINAKILKFNDHVTQFGTTTKMLIEDANGNRYYGTYPLSASVKRGDMIEIAATVERKDDHFGFFSRPKLVVEKVRITAKDAKAVYEKLKAMDDLPAEFVTVENVLHDAMQRMIYDREHPFCLEFSPKDAAVMKKLIAENEA